MADFIDATPALPAGVKVIESYGPQGFVISGARHAGAVLVCDTQVWPLAAMTLNDLRADMLQPLQTLAEPPTLLLLGTGVSQRFPAPELKRELRMQGLTVEAMTSASACRTYAVLLAEGRQVAALLLPIT